MIAETELCNSSGPGLSLHVGLTTERMAHGPAGRLHDVYLRCTRDDVRDVKKAIEILCVFFLITFLMRVYMCICRRVIFRTVICAAAFRSQSRIPSELTVSGSTGHAAAKGKGDHSVLLRVRWN